MERAILGKIDQALAEGNAKQADLGRDLYVRFLELTGEGMTDIDETPLRTYPNQTASEETVSKLHLPVNETE